MFKCEFALDPVPLESSLRSMISEASATMKKERGIAYNNASQTSDLARSKYTDSDECVY